MQILLLHAAATEGWSSRIADELWIPGEPAIRCAYVAPADACRLAGTMHPDVVVLDFQRGLRTLGQLAMASPRTRALLMYARCTIDDVAEAVRRGAAGCIPHAVTTELLAKAVRTVAAGGAWWGRMALLEALRAQMSVSAPPQHGGSLTQREEEILQLIGHGLSNKEIARRLEISDHTVKTHLHRIYSKLQRSGRYKAYLAQPGAATPDQ